MIYSDTSKKGLGYILIQHGKVVAYASRQLIEYEKNCSTHDQELVAVVFTLKIQRHYLYGEKLKSTPTIRVQYFFTQKELSMRQLFHPERTEHEATKVVRNW